MKQDCELQVKLGYTTRHSLPYHNGKREGNKGKKNYNILKDGVQVHSDTKDGCSTRLFFTEKRQLTNMDAQGNHFTETPTKVKEARITHTKRLLENRILAQFSSIPTISTYSLLRGGGTPWWSPGQHLR